MKLKHDSFGGPGRRPIRGGCRRLWRFGLTLSRPSTGAAIAWKPLKLTLKGRQFISSRAVLGPRSSASSRRSRWGTRSASRGESSSKAKAARRKRRLSKISSSGSPNRPRGAISTLVPKPWTTPWPLSTGTAGTSTHSCQDRGKLCSKRASNRTCFAAILAPRHKGSRRSRPWIQRTQPRLGRKHTGIGSPHFFPKGGQGNLSLA